MDPEQLKSVIEALSHLGDNATSAFIWYLCAKVVTGTLPYVIGWTGGITAIVVIAKTVRSAIGQCSASGRLAEASGAKTRYDGGWRPEELQKACAFFTMHRADWRA